MKHLLGLAPMDGFTDMACRWITQRVFEQYGEKDRFDFQLWTEFMNADGYIKNPPGVVKHLLTLQPHSPTIAQIFSGNEEMLLQTFSAVAKHYPYFFGIELNLGCPALGVMRNGGGADMLKDKERTLKIIARLRSQTTLPFSIKTRTGINESDRDAQMQFLIEASKHIDMITIHGRTVKQAYAGDADWSFVYQLKQAIDPKVKVLGNGSIHRYQDILDKISILDGCMIGQSAIGNPWIFTHHTPSLQEKLHTILDHLHYKIASEIYFHEIDFSQRQPYPLLMDEAQLFKDVEAKLQHPDLQPLIKRSLVEFRKHLFSYIKGLPGSKEFKVHMSTISTYDETIIAIKDFFDSLS